MVEPKGRAQQDLNRLAAINNGLLPAQKEDNDEKKEAKYVQSLERSLNILEMMAAEGAPVAVSELADKVGLKVSTVHRLLSTLLHRGYVAQRSLDNRYHLGLKLLEIGNAALYTSDIRTVARPCLESLVDSCNETASLAVLDGSDVVYIDQVESKNMIIVKMFAQAGNRGPVHCTASGKALLAFTGEEKLAALLPKIELARYTSETIVDLGHLQKELSRVRQDGYAVDLGEREEHVRCIAAPIFNHDSQVIASISISGPSTRITNYQIKHELADLIKSVAQKISLKMGYPGGNGQG